MFGGQAQGGSMGDRQPRSPHNAATHATFIQYFCMGRVSKKCVMIDPKLDNGK